MPVQSAPGLADWLAEGVAYVHRLLNEVMGEAAPVAADAGAWARLVLCKPGHVLLSRTHLDLYLPPNAADIRLRQVGLDRNPGWVPDLGYIIQFHFEERLNTS